MSKLNINRPHIRRKLTGFLTIVFAGALGLSVSAALAANAKANPVPAASSVTKASKKLDRDWVWKKKTVNFDGMYR